MAHPYTERLEDLQYLKGNFTFTPNYIDLIKGIWNTISWYYAPRMWNGYTFPHSLIDDFTRNFYFPLNQIYYIVYIAILITLIRYLFEKLICKVCSMEKIFFRNFIFVFSISAICRLA
jgi:hypothetical protein